MGYDGYGNLHGRNGRFEAQQHSDRGPSLSVPNAHAGGYEAHDFGNYAPAETARGEFGSLQGTADERGMYAFTTESGSLQRRFLHEMEFEKKSDRPGAEAYAANMSAVAGQYARDRDEWDADARIASAKSLESVNPDSLSFYTRDAYDQVTMASDGDTDEVVERTLNLMAELRQAGELE